MDWEDTPGYLGGNLMILLCFGRVCWYLMLSAFALFVYYLGGQTCGQGSSFALHESTMILFLNTFELDSWSGDFVLAWISFISSKILE